MKKFITLTLCLLLCVATLGLSACGKKKTETVDTSIQSVGNGGTVVKRGEYVYFVNGYKSYSTIRAGKDNKDNSYNVGGLYRAKLNDNNELDYSENGSVSNAERISSDLAGFESTSLYVFGNRVYYATPITEVDKKGNSKKDRIEFKKVSLDGGNAETIYQSHATATNVDYEFYYAEGVVYLMINENGTLKRINCLNGSSNTVASGVTSVALPRDTDDVFESDSYKNIYYTVTNGDGKIEIHNYNVASNRTEYKKVTDYKTCEMIDYRFGHLYYKASDNEVPNYTYFYRVDATENAVTSLPGSAEQLTKDKDYTEIIFLENETDGHLFQGADKTYYLQYNSGSISDPLHFDSKLDVIAVGGGYIYTKSEHDIKRINIHYLKTAKNKTQEDVITIENLQAYEYDIDGDYLYVYATTGSNTYLYSVKLTNIMEGESFERKLLGSYIDSDVPKDE